MPTAGCSRDNPVTVQPALGQHGPVPIDQQRALDAGTPLVVVGAVVALVSTGLGHGIWWANVHNGLLSLAFGGVAAWTLLVRPGQREALLFALVGVLEGALFLGRQVAHHDPDSSGTWWGWFGVWPIGLVLAVTTWAVLCFPEGIFGSRGWRRVGIAVLAVGAGCSLMSALWPVEYAAAGVDSPPPFALAWTGEARRIWGVVAHPAYALFQVIWVVAVLARWRTANGVLRGQFRLMAVAVGAATAALLVGLAAWHSPRLGLLATPAVPIVAGWVMVHLSLGRVVEETRASGGLASLSLRENEVLDLMAQGLSNQAIADRLYLSIKTVEPVVSSIFMKLQLPSDSATNRRVLAVLALLDE